MSRPDAAGRLQKWSIMLGEHNITYRPRTSIKGQILADFLNEIPSNALQGTSVAETQEEPWTLFTDGSSCVDGSGAGLILTNPDGVEFTYALRFQFAASNNEAEYEALIAGLRIATQIGVKNIQANVDSKLVANQVLGTLKNTKKKDKIGSKPDKNGKRVEAEKSLKQLQLKKEEKPKKTKKEWLKTHTRIKSYSTLKERRKEKGQKCNSSKVSTTGAKFAKCSNLCTQGRLMQ
nr:reverse transcriptase domain-containing protein [Tanacetum cinerariifolium]